MNIPYPSNYFDPYCDELQWVVCCQCGKEVDCSDAQPTDKLDRNGKWICDWCVLPEEECNNEE